MSYNIRYPVQKLNNHYLNYYDLVARHSTKLLTGNGVLLQYQAGEQKEWIERFMFLNRFNNFCSNLAYNLSVKGEVVVGFDLPPDGITRLYIANPLTRIIKVHNEIVGAEIWKQIVRTTFNNIYYIREVWTKETITRTYFHNQQKISFSAIQAPVPQEFVLPAEEVNKSGIIPAIDFQNLPNKLDNEQYYGDIRPDNAYVAILNKLTRIMLSEAAKNTTKVIGNFNDLQQKDQFQQQVEQGQMSDMFLNYQSGSTNPISLLQGDPKLTEYKDIIEFYLEQLFKSAGYNYTNTATQTSVETATKVISSKSLDQNTTNLKKRMFEARMNDLFDIISNALQWPKGFNFQLNNAVELNMAEKIANMEKMLELGLITKKDAIKSIYNLDEVDAAKKEAEIVEEYKTNQQLIKDNQPQQEEVKETETDD